MHIRSINPVQLSLGLEGNHHSTLANFFPGEHNRVLVRMIRRLLSKGADKNLGIYGPHQVGKTHLLTAACMASQDSGVPSGYLPMAEIVETRSARIVTGLDYLGLICIDDLQSLCGQVEWEQALVELCVRMRARAGRVIFSADRDPLQLPWQNSDFVAYLVSACVMFPCHPLKETEKIALLEEHAMLNGVLMPAAVSKYLVSHYGADLASLLRSVKCIQEYTAGRKRKVNLALVKEILVLV